MIKKFTKLTEDDLHRIVKKSVNRILNESIEDERELHSVMWNLLVDAYNCCINMSKGGDLYKKAFDEHIFPLIRNIDEKLGC